MRMPKQFTLDLRGKLICDLFAGGGGASCGIEQATGLYVDIAVNHDAQAISMHTANHPQTRHFQTDVFDVDPAQACGGRPVGLLHLSPDCTHHSQAAGGQPRSNAVRSLSWVGKRWAAQVRPEVITLENVKQITRWGRLVAKRDKASGRVIKTDGTIAAAGECVPVRQQYLVPDPKRTGERWQKFVHELEKLGYAVGWRILCAADYGAPTTRERLFMVARRDGLPIVWPEPTHFRRPAKGQKKWRSAAGCIDWTLVGKSVFDRPKPLAENTLKRIAKGIKKFVLDNPQPFVTGTRAAVLINAAHGEGSGASRRRGIGSRDITQPVGTVTASGNGGHALACAYLMQANDGFNSTFGRDAAEPLTTITNSGSQQQLISACLIRQFGASTGSDISEPVGTIMSDGGGGKTSLAVCELGSAKERALRVADFLIRYGEGFSDGLDTEGRLKTVTLHIGGEPYYITDITLRMLEPKELYKAQGFPDSYIYDRDGSGRPLTKTAQVRMCGNSVSPPPMAALIRANYRPDEALDEQQAA